MSAQWRYLTMINYSVDREILDPLVPRGCELDLWNDQAYVSLVGFRFLDTRLKGIPIPFHRDFDEINLRFYVRRKDHENETDGDWKRAVAFVKEIVPKRAIALTARLFYNEPYIAVPTRHVIKMDVGSGEKANRIVRYGWKFRGKWNSISVRPVGDPNALTDGSEEQFIAEHYWGYTAQKDGGTLEYQVTHPAWRVWSCVDPQIEINVAELYGSQFETALRQTPTSAFLAEGSDVSVSNGRRVE
ncbi:MAG: DUF2071 domain-containing protein [Planctomycetales bacterium]|nr:DUF2071 domain-containing protein [Planctomycetales bacterium]